MRMPARWSGTLLGVVVGAVVAAGAPADVPADAQAAYALMEQSHLAYYYGADGGSARVTMTLTDKKGRTRERQFWILRRDVEDLGDQRYFTYFVKPGDVARMAFLVHKKPEANDDRWLYVPALDLVKRIAADDRRSSFVGSDFTYEDISGRLPSLDEHTILGAESVEGRAATKVRSTPKDAKTADYAYRITWVDDETKLPLREEYYDDKDAVVRRFVATDIETIDGVPTALERTMTVLDKNHSTTIRFADISYASPLDPDKFNERLLKNPPAAYRR